MAGTLVSQEELQMLLTPLPEHGLFLATNFGFKCRNMFLLLCAIFFSISLIFFSENFYPVLNLPASMETFFPLSQNRGWLYFFWLPVYGLSFVKDWYFERVAIVCFASEVTLFCLGYLNLFRFLNGPVSPLLIFFILLHVLLIACLLVNAIYAHQAPRRGRSLWR